MGNTLLLLPGMGDIYWACTKIESYMKKHGIAEPMDTWIWNFDGRPRSIEYARLFPFLNVIGYHDTPPPDSHDHVFKESYITGPRTFFHNYRGFDLYVAANGALRAGMSLHETDPEYEVNWHPPMLELPVALEQEVKKFKNIVGPYIITHFSDMGMFKNWVRVLPAEEVATLLFNIAKHTGKSIVLTGCEWDAKFNHSIIEEIMKLQYASQSFSVVLNKTGQTSMHELLVLMQNSDGMIGWCGGNTIMCNYYGIKNVIFWHDYFKDNGFYTNSVPPNPNYKVVGLCGSRKFVLPPVVEKDIISHFK